MKADLNGSFYRLINCRTTTYENKKKVYYTLICNVFTKLENPQIQHVNIYNNIVITIRPINMYLYYIFTASTQYIIQENNHNIK